MSYLDLVEAQLRAADTLDPSLRAFIRRYDRNVVTDQAQQADAAWQEGRSLGLLHGMTVSLKDNIDTAGVASTSGAAFLRDHVPQRNATVVDRLLRAGAIIVGKANMNELAFGVRSHSTIGGQCRNPWNPERIPGGSSGGSGAGVAAGMCTGSLGTDTGGSVRLPAACTGIAGLRPTYGVVPNTGVLPVSESHDVVGPMAHRVEDVARLFVAIAGQDDQDEGSVASDFGHVLTGLHGGIRGLRIGVPTNYYFDGCSGEVVEHVQSAVRTLERAGAVLVDLHVPMVERAQEMAIRHVFADACYLHRDPLAAGPENFSPAVYDRMKRGLEFSAVDIAEAIHYQRRWKHALRRVFDSVDIIASPTIPVVAPPIEEGRSLLEASQDLTRNTFVSAFGGIPSLSVPCGFGADGMPIGLLLDAPWQEEGRLFRTGFAFQQATDFHRRRPG